MRLLLDSVYRRWLKFIKSDKTTQHKLNYLTLNIDSKEITRDLYLHSIDQKISLFWIVNILAIVNIIMHLLSYLQSGKKESGKVYFGLIYLITLGPIFAVLRWRFKRAVRYLPVLIFLLYSTFLCLGVLLPGGRKMIAGVEQIND
jgi:hypothetical protein